MASDKTNPLLLVIVGPTGSGKTALSLSLALGALAEKFAGSEIVSCDSVAVYREFEIGTAKPSREERARVPHHMIDVASANKSFTAGEYARRTRTLLRDIQKRGRVPIVTGGTGLYLRALIDGLSPGPPRSEQLRERLRQRAEAKGSAYLHRILNRMDPAAAAAIHANDLPKLIRGIEVCLSVGEKMTNLWRQGRDPLTGFRIVRIGLNPDRALLYARIDARCRRMFDLGLVDETRELLNKYPATLLQLNSPLNALGYRQAAQFVRGEVSYEEAISAAQQAHRNYAKRQLTWFRRDPEIKWLAGFGDDASVQAQASELASR